MDEKGPQSSFKISVPFDTVNKLSYGNDNMHSYVANIIDIEETDYINIEHEYKEIVKEYLLTRPQLKMSLEKKGKELKGLDILKSNFKFGIASMKTNEIKFYTKVLDLLLKYDVKNLLFMISKMSVITSSRLIEFFYFLDLNKKISPFFIKYIITKYAEIEASEEVIKAFLDRSVSTKDILKLIQKDMHDFIKRNQNIVRTTLEVESYKQIIMAINIALQSKNAFLESNLPISFDWNKVKWAFDLWLTEQNFNDSETKWWLFLDEGIPKELLSDLCFDKIESDCNSKNYIGLQITDVLVVLIGKLISQLNQDTRYDFAKPNTPKLVNKGYFCLSKEQYELFVKLNQFILSKNRKYGFINDTYFDDSVLLQSYIEHIASYNSYEEYAEVEETTHSELHMRDFIQISNNKFEEALQCDFMIKSLYGTVKEAIENNMVRPL